MSLRFIIGNCVEFYRKNNVQTTSCTMSPWLSCYLSNMHSPTFPRTFFAKKSTWIYFLMKRFGHFMNLISLFFSEQIWSILLNLFADTLPCLSWGSGVHLGLQKLAFAIQNVCLSTFLSTFCWHFEIIINSQISLM